MNYDSKTHLITGGSRLTNIFLSAGVVGLLITAFGYFTEPQQFFYSYFNAFIYWWTLCMGGLFFVMLHHLTSSTWSVVLRKIVESVAMVAPLLAILFIPIFFGMNEIWIWSDPAVMAEDHLLQKKAGFLNDTFFVIRYLIYFSIWIFIAYKLHKTSLEQDKGHSENLKLRFSKISAPGMILFALSSSLAAFDWIMSLDPHWFSTIFGIYVFGGSLLSFLCLMIVLMRFLQSRGILKGVVTIEHYVDIARLMFAFTIFWAYIGFSQYFLIWYANIPEETVWYMHRWEGNWSFFSLLLLFGHFIFPFLALMLRAVKRNLILLTGLAIWVLVMHWVDIYWLIMPNLHHHGAHLSWMDATAFLGIGSVFFGFFWRNLTSHVVVPVGDPRLQASIEIIN